VISDADRVATATLLRVCEPGSLGLSRHVRKVGVAQALADIQAGAQIPDVEAEGLRHRLATASGERDLLTAAAVGARLLCPGDDEWPTALGDLRHRDLDCFGLWVRGRLRLAEATERSVAVVGTRAATDYGVHVAHDLGVGLAERGWSVVSGLAFGIDAAAHRGALAAEGTTVAVLACGVDVPYPPGNRSLYERIADEGLVLSEHPPGAAPQRHRFLVRNRVIAALALGTVVVEMAPRSGAKSTAVHAAYLNRYVMAVPGPVTSAMSVGCHQFMRERPDVVLVTKADEVIEMCGHLGELAEQPTGQVRARDLLGPVVGRVFEGVPVQRPAEVSGIATAAAVSARAAAAALAALESQGLVERVGEGLWVMTALGRKDRRAHRAVQQQQELDWW
jgi:DNA processing protein